MQLLTNTVVKKKTTKYFIGLIFFSKKLSPSTELKLFHWPDFFFKNLSPSTELILCGELTLGSAS